MVPFYGQGMNSGFEDVSALSDILDKHLSKTSSPSSAEIGLALDGIVYLLYIANMMVRIFGN